MGNELKKVLMEFFEANNYFGTGDEQNAEGIVDCFIETYYPDVDCETAYSYE